ncbi:hypothetical protein [Accumulibacter sp.]|uniref:hypothetical protein n=1 Tax=Accumulibacter sp. TaxID=2053492 RepID=UPI0035B43AFD
MSLTPRLSPPNLCGFTRRRQQPEHIGLTADEKRVQADFSAVESRLDAANQSEQPNAFADRLEMINYAGKSLDAMGWGGEQVLGTWISEAEATGIHLRTPIEAGLAVAGKAAGVGDGDQKQVQRPGEDVSLLDVVFPHQPMIEPAEMRGQLPLTFRIQ